LDAWRTKICDYTITLALFILLPFNTSAQQDDSLTISRIYSYALNHFDGYENLRYLCKITPGRLAGSQAAEAAVSYTFALMKNMGLDSVYLQSVTVPHWDPGDIALAKISSSIMGTSNLSICALGPSVATPAGGLTAPIIEVQSFDDLQALGEEKIAGKIVFFNRPMAATQFNPMKAYIDAVEQRIHGAKEAAKYDAVAVLVRSLTNCIDDFPHTGVMRYQEGIEQIPAAAVSTKDAERLNDWLKQDAALTCSLKMNCIDMGETESYNVIGEIRGSKYPDTIILTGAHLDAWFNSEGAHDNGAGCIHTLDVLRIFNALEIKPNYTIRTVLFMDEEMSQTGAKSYAEAVRHHNEKHLAAVESDRGGMLPLGFTIDADDHTIKECITFKKYFVPYGALRFEKGYGGVDIDPLKAFDVPLIGFLPATQRYFDYHHSANDTFEQVHLRELQLGSASIASLIYLIDTYGLE
jgi:carboxypeptidase Q